MRNLSRHLTYANVMSTLAVVLVIGGGVAYAANTVFSGDIVDGEVKSVDIGNNQVLSADVRTNSLTGADIADQSGVDTCVSTTRIGQLCVRAENFARPWAQARDHCANLDLRLPTLGEAVELAKTHTIPDVTNELFWTDELVHRYEDPGGNLPWAYSVIGVSSGQPGGGSVGLSRTTDVWETVCVTTPTN